MSRKRLLGVESVGFDIIAEPSRAEPSRAEPSRAACVFMVVPPKAIRLPA